MCSSRAAVERYFEAFNRADRAGILSVLTDDAVWDIPRTHLGSGRASGKDAFADEALKAPRGTVATVSRLVGEGNVVVAEGTVTTSTPDGSPFTLLFCDVFVVRDGRIAQLTSYLAQGE
ncbi:MAG TPA: nuclear transport factor 2 family protein [Chloroflexota bacterium]|nr:nuclear transport factor 2 family protein [Chloroflexota bacterium]